MAKRVPISHGEFCDIVSAALRSNIVDFQSCRNKYDSESLKAFCDIRISQFQDALVYLRKIRSLGNV